MANAMKFHATVKDNQLLLTDLAAFEGQQVEVIVILDAKTPAPDDQKPKAPRQFGLLRGQIEIAEDFDAPLDDDILDAIYNKGVDP